MKTKELMSNALLRPAAAAVVIGLYSTVGMATEPCGDLGECKALIEINSSDGDIGFHFLSDGDDLIRNKVKNPDGDTIFKAAAREEFREQFYTEMFVESAEPLCFDPTTDDDETNDDEDFLTLEEFAERWDAGTYRFVGIGEDERSRGETELSFELPAAPEDLEFYDETGVISWDDGEDLGECANEEELEDLVHDRVLPTHPEDVEVASWEVVFEPDVEDFDPNMLRELQLTFTIRVPGDISPKRVTVPQEFLDSLPDDTPAKFEVGAIGADDNATFTEMGDICVNEVHGCGGD